MCILSNLSRQFSAFRPDHLIAVSLVLIFYFEIVFNGEKNLPDYPTILLLLLDFKQTFFFSPGHYNICSMYGFRASGY